MIYYLSCTFAETKGIKNKQEKLEQGESKKVNSKFSKLDNIYQGDHQNKDTSLNDIQN